MDTLDLVPEDDRPRSRSRRRTVTTKVPRTRKLVAPPREATSPWPVVALALGALVLVGMGGVLRDEPREPARRVVAATTKAPSVAPAPGPSLAERERERLERERRALLEKHRALEAERRAREKALACAFLEASHEGALASIEESGRRFEASQLIDRALACADKGELLSAELLLERARDLRFEDPRAAALEERIRGKAPVLILGGMAIVEDGPAETPERQ